MLALKAMEIHTPISQDKMKKHDLASDDVTNIKKHRKSESPKVQNIKDNASSSAIVEDGVSHGNVASPMVPKTQSPDKHISFEDKGDAKFQRVLEQEKISSSRSRLPVDKQTKQPRKGVVAQDFRPRAPRNFTSVIMNEKENAEHMCRTIDDDCLSHGALDAVIEEEEESKSP